MPKSARPQKLAGAERQTALSGLEGWTLLADRDAIQRRFTFKNFSAAFGWMTRAALAAERLDHHPEWLNVWNRVDVTLTTHSAGGLTVLDAEMARILDELFAGR
mgnify:CR=1 FL=1